MPQIRPVGVFKTALLALLAVSTAGMNSCFAQSFWMNSVSAWASQQEAAKQPNATANGPLLRRLPASTSGFRLTGEEASVTLPVYVTARQAAAKARFRLATVTSVSVTPETGTLGISINGAGLTSIAVGKPYSLQTSEFDIPEGSLSPGWNSISIAAHHRHRVDCSVEATNELWTRIDPADSGIVFPQDAGNASNIEDIAAVSPRADGATPINVILGERHKLTPENVERLSRTVSRIALRGQFAQPIVGFGSSDQGGIDLVLGTLANIQGTINPDTIGPVNGAFDGMIPGGNGRNPTLVIAGTTDAELDQAIDRLTQIDPVGTPEGLKALKNAKGQLVSPDGQSFSFGELGLPNLDVNGHALRTGFNIKLPSDFLPADYGRVSVDLAGGYGANLTPSAQVVILINGTSAGSVRLSAIKGDTFDHKRVFLPLSAFHPGSNRVDIQIDVPEAADVGCDTSIPAIPHSRFWLNSTTRISFPALARIGRQPDLAMTASAGFPYERRDEKMTLVVPTPDPETLSAALTWLVRLGISAGHPLSFSFALNQPSETKGNVVVVAPARTLDPTRMREAELNPDTVKAAWSIAAEPSAATLAPTSRASLRRRALHADYPDSCTLTSGDVAGRIPLRQSREDLTGSLRSSESGYRHVFENWFAGPLTSLFGNAFTAGVSTARPIDFSGASLVVAQGIRESDPNSVLTIVTSPTAALLNHSIACLVSPQVWPGLSGRLSALNASTGELTSQGPEKFHYINSEAFSLHNERLVAAGLLSLNPGVFALLAFLLLLPLAWTTHRLVRRLGRANG